MTFGPRHEISPGPLAPTSLPSSSRNRISMFAISPPDAVNESLTSRSPLWTQGPDSSVQPYARKWVSLDWLEYINDSSSAYFDTMPPLGTFALTFWQGWAAIKRWINQ